MGAYTSNNYFYLPALGATGSSEKSAFDAALQATDAVIASLVAAVNAQTGLKISVQAGENIAQYEAVYMASDGKIYKCDADSETAVKCIGIAVAAITAEATGQIYTVGQITNAGWSFTIGGKVYISTTAGALTQTPPSGNGDFVLIVGIAISATKLLFRPEYRYTEV